MKFNWQSNKLEAKETSRERSTTQDQANVKNNNSVIVVINKHQIKIQKYKTDKPKTSKFNSN
jgi:hypothetical protein